MTQEDIDEEQKTGEANIDRLEARCMAFTVKYLSRPPTTDLMYEIANVDNPRGSSVQEDNFVNRKTSALHLVATRTEKEIEEEEEKRKYEEKQAKKTADKLATKLKRRVPKR